MWLECGYFYVVIIICFVVSICYVKLFGLLLNKVSIMELEFWSIFVFGIGLLEILGYGIIWIVVVVVFIYFFGWVNKIVGIVGMVVGCVIFI